MPSHRAQVFSLATSGAQPRHQAASRLCRTRAVVTAPLRELGGGGRRGKGEAEGRGRLSLPPENPGRPALTPSASARRPRRPPARPAAPRDRSGPSAVRTPGASTRPQASGAPREGPRGLRQRPRGGGREPGRAGGVPAAGRRHPGPRPLRVAPCHSHFGSGGSGRGSADRRSGTGDLRPETWAGRRGGGDVTGMGRRVGGARAGARGRAGRGGASRAGGPRRSLRQVSGLQLRVLAAAGTDAEARGALGSEKGLCR